MSADLHDRLSASYPATDIAMPPADALWQQGRRRHRLRTAGAAVVAVVVVSAVGFAAATLDPAPAAPSVMSTTNTDQADDTDAGATEAAPSVPEPSDPDDRAVPDDRALFDLSVLLCDGQICADVITSDEQERLRQALEAHPAVAEVFFESKQQAAERFRALFEDQPELVDSVDVDALPASFRVKLHDPEQVPTVAEHFASYAGVEEVLDHRSCSPGACEGFVPDVADQ